ncbi:hypothetical protein Pelo_11452 [Pelomyxa schiedti]|nr:hypothetical protein Pelo_11452 [Pelomyxa schiedti]
MSEESYTVDGTVLGIALGVAFGAPTLVILVVFCCFSLSKRTRARLCHGYYCKKCCVQCCRKPCKQCCFKCKRCCCGRGSSKGKINSAPLLLSNFYGWLAARAAPSKEDIERYLKLYPFFMELASTTRLPFPSFDMLLIWFIHAVNPQDFITPAVLKSKLLVTPTPSADKLTKLWKVKYKVDYPAAPPTTVSTPSSFPVLSIDTALKRATALHNYAASMSTFSVTTCGLKTFRLRFVRLVSFYASHKTSAAPVPEYVTETRKLLIPPLPMEFVWQSFMLLPKKYSSITTGQYASGPLPHSVMIPRQQAVEAKLAFSRVWEEAFHEQLKLRPLPPSDPKPATTEPEPKPKPTKTHKKHQKHHHRKPSVIVKAAAAAAVVVVILTIPPQHRRCFQLCVQPVPAAPPAPLAPYAQHAPHAAVAPHAHLAHLAHHVPPAHHAPPAPHAPHVQAAAPAAVVVGAVGVMGVEVEAHAVVVQEGVAAVVEEEAVVVVVANNKITPPSFETSKASPILVLIFFYFSKEKF